jgi:hypothetical protein
MIKLLAIFSITSTIAFGQVRLTGKVIDSSNNELLPGVNISIKGTDIGTISNSNGEFELTIASDSAIVIFSFIGFNTYQLKIFESTSIEIKLQETQFSSPSWQLKRGNKPLSKKKNKLGTVYLYASEVISLDPKRLTPKIAIWQLRNYKILLPFDSLIKHLESVGYRPYDIEFGLNYLNSKAQSDTVSLSSEFVDRVGEVPLNDLAIKMLKTKTIGIISEKGEYIKSITARDVFWVGRCPLCCWEGVEFIISDKEPALFTITRIIC